MFFPYRYHVVQEFNKGVYDYIIATDESGTHGEHDEEEEDKDKEGEGEELEEEEECQSRSHSKFRDYICLTHGHSQLLQHRENPHKQKRLWTLALQYQNLGNENVIHLHQESLGNGIET